MIASIQSMKLDTLQSNMRGRTMYAMDMRNPGPVNLHSFFQENHCGGSC